MESRPECSFPPNPAEGRREEGEPERAGSWCRRQAAIHTLDGWVGTDANGYDFGPEMLSATDESKGVSYGYFNPETGGFGEDHTGALEYKDVWLVEHDGPVFGSGRHHDESGG